jgi:protoheme ferro-lyase
MTEKQTQKAANIAKIGLIVLWLAFMYSITSCGSSCSRTKRYWRNHRCVEVKSDTVPDYFYVNNQIVMVEKERN